MRKKNRFYLSMLAGALAALIVFTYISTQVYRQSLPVVETAEPAAGTVKRTYTMEGVFSYTTQQEILLPVPVLIESVAVREGEIVGEGMELLRLDIRALEIELLRLELELEAMREKENKLEDERAAQIFAYEREQKETEYQRLQELYAAGGIFYAAGRGEVREVYTETGSREAAGKLLLSVCDLDGGAEISWSMKEEGILFERFYVELRQTNGHVVSSGTVILENYKKSYDPQTDRVFYTASVPEQKEMLSMHDAETLTVTAYYVSEVYGALIPLSAITYDADGTAYVYELRSREKSFGMEYYVRKQTISVIEKDGTHAASGGSFKNMSIIVNSSQALQDRAAVWVEY